MTWSYAAAPGWLRFEGRCAPEDMEAKVADWVTKMTSRSGVRTKHAFGSWAMWNGPQWGPMWAGGARSQGAPR